MKIENVSNGNYLHAKDYLDIISHLVEDMNAIEGYLYYRKVYIGHNPNFDYKLISHLREMGVEERQKIDTDGKLEVELMELVGTSFIDGPSQKDVYKFFLFFMEIAKKHSDKLDSLIYTALLNELLVRHGPAKLQSEEIDSIKLNTKEKLFLLELILKHSEKAIKKTPSFVKLLPYIRFDDIAESTLESNLGDFPKWFNSPLKMKPETIRDRLSSLEKVYDLLSKFGYDRIINEMKTTTEDYMRSFDKALNPTK